MSAYFKMFVRFLLILINKLMKIYVYPSDIWVTTYVFGKKIWS